MKVLVTGGRNFRDSALIYDALDAIFETDAEEMIVVSGGATGADRRAMDWCVERQIPYFTFPARWRKFGNSAGYIRNADMLKRARPDVVLAFPTPGAENKGTQGMISIATKAGIMVIDVVDVHKNNQAAKIINEHLERMK